MFGVFLFTAATARSRRQVRHGRDRTPLQNWAAGDYTRGADGQPSRVLRIQIVSEQRAEAGDQRVMSGQVRAEAGENQGRGRNVPRDAVLSGHREQGVRNEVRVARTADVQPVRVAMEIRRRQQLGRVRKRYRRSGLRAAGRVQGVCRYIGV